MQYIIRKYLALLLIAFAVMLSSQKLMAYDTNIAMGEGFACGIKADRTVHCWGKDSSAINPPVGKFKQISAADDHACGLKTDGTINCWGDDRYGETSPPPGVFTQIDAGFYHGCGVRTDNQVICWGSNSDGQTTVPDTTFAQVSAGATHSCGLTTTNELKCWGSVTNAPEGKFTYVSAGTHGMICAIKEDGSAACTGNNNYNYSLGFVKQISVTSYSTYALICSLKHNGSVDCYGSYMNSPLKDKFFDSVAASHYIYGGCGILTTGEIECWGRSPDGVNRLDTIVKDDVFPKDIIFLVENNTPIVTPTNQNPIANFTFSATDKTVNLDATSSYDPDGIITQYNWATSNGLAAAGQITSLNFPNYGRYDVNLSVIDDYGSVSTKSQSINLQQIVTNYTVNGITDGKGSLTINADNCGNNCSRQYPENSQISITAIPNSGYVLDKWAGACSGNTSTCIITVSNDTTVQAFFKQQITSETFNVGIQTGGNGFITTKDQTCTQSNCSLNLTVQQGELVRFQATPNAGYEFDSWSGVCIGSTDPICEVTLTGNISIQANFKQQAPDNVVLTTTTNGNGIITASGSDCSTGCSFTPNTRISLVATPQTGYKFTGWNGCVSSSETCSLEMTANTVVTANFAEQSTSTDKYSLSVNIVDSFGTPLTNTDLNASVIGENINCGTDFSICQAEFAENATVNLIFSTSVGTEFVEWTGGGCSGNNTKCVIKMTQDRQVTAIFQKTSVQTNALNITIKGSGLVNVKGDDLEAICNATSCEPIVFERDSSKRMTLVANPLLGFKFTGWDGACSGAGDCSLAMGKDHAVRAVFEPMQGGFELSVIREGTGSGKVSGDGIACGFGDDICDSNYPEGLTVTLNTETGVNSLFVGWQGACASFKDEPECIVTMNSDMRVLAEFELDNSSLGKRIILTKHAVDNNGNPVEDVASSGYVFDTKLNTNLKGVNCATNCKSHKGIYDGLNTTTVTLQAQSYVGSQFSHWSGACSGQASLCQVTLASEERNVEITANFVQTLPPLKTIIAGGATTETQGEWAGGIAKIDAVNTPVTYGAYLKKQTIVASDEADIKIMFKPDPAHYAQEVDIVVILGYAVPESIFPAEYYTMGERDIPRWSGSPADILARRKDVFLTDTVEKIQLYSGHLPIGNVWLYAGYRLNTGEIIFNEEAVNVRVNP